MPDVNEAKVDAEQMASALEAFPSNGERSTICTKGDRLLNEAATLLRTLAARVGEEEAAHSKTIAERDHAEEMIAEAYTAVIGEPPEWSNHFSFRDAIDYMGARVEKLSDIAEAAEARASAAEGRLAEQQRTIETLSRALAWFGDWQRMATTREDWQQTIDEALGWVQANPEPGRPSRPSFNSAAEDRLARASRSESMIPAEIAELALRIGRAQWGQTHAHDAEGHAAHIAESVRITAEHFGQEGPQNMHGLYIEGTETVICHTGTSPNSPGIAQALTGAWNWLWEQSNAAALTDNQADASRGEGGR